MELDRTDLLIVSELARNARLSLVELSERVNLSTTAIARRLAALEEAGIITGYSVVLDMPRLGYTTTVLLRIALESQSDEALSAFEAGVARCPSITRCFLMSGTDDYLAIVVAKDLQDFERIHRTELSRLPRVSRMQSSFALREIVQLPAPQAMFESVSRARPRRA